MIPHPLPPELLERVAERFRVLGEPARLRIMEELRDGGLTVSEVVDATGLGQANTSRHLSLLHQAGFVGRSKEGLHVRYFLADDSVLELCDAVCARIVRQAESVGAMGSGRAGPGIAGEGAGNADPGSGHGRGPGA